MFNSLQNDNETKLNEEIKAKTVFEFVDYQIKQHLKDLRRKDGDLIEVKVKENLQLSWDFLLVMENL